MVVSDSDDLVHFSEAACTKSRATRLHMQGSTYIIVVRLFHTYLLLISILTPLSLIDNSHTNIEGAQCPYYMLNVVEFEDKYAADLISSQSSPK